MISTNVRSDTIVPVVAGRFVTVALATGLAATVLISIVRYPLTIWPLAAALAAYSALLWYRPVTFLLIIPIVLPAWDAGPWTGWTMVEESDLFIATTLAVLLVRQTPKVVDFVPRSAAAAILWSFTACWLVAALVGLASPLGAPRSNNFLLRPDNALRIAKSLIEALALLPFLRQRHRLYGDVATWLGLGLAAGLVAVTLIVLAERALFTDILSFSATYRVVGPFSSMRVGGGYIGAYAALALPFSLSLFQLRPRWVAMTLAPLACLCGGYTVAVTLARTAYAASAFAMTIAALGYLISTRPRRTSLFTHAVVPSILILAILAALSATVLFTGMSARFATSAGDLVIRQDNWRAGLAVRNRDVPTDLFGMGLGSYQRAMLMRSVVNRPSQLVLNSGDQGVYASIRSETPFFLGQKISLPETGPLHLTLWARASNEQTTLGTMLCDKVLLYSDNCRGTNTTLSQPGQWAQLRATIATDGLGSRALAGLLRRPVELSLFGSVGHIVDLRDVALTDDAGRSSLVNGNFAENLDHWVFTDDGHIAWRMKNLYLMLFFETGLVGVAAYAALAGLAFAGSIRALRAGFVIGAPLAGSIVGFMISGLFDNVLEVPRLATLFFLICWCGLIQWEAGARAPD